MDENITITRKEYFGLRKDELRLQLLEGGGVDNWEGYSFSLEEEDKYIEDIKKEIYPDAA